MDGRGHRAVLAAANKSSLAALAGKWTEATRRWEAVEGGVLAATKHVDFYNILTPVAANQEEPRDRAGSNTGRGEAERGEDGEYLAEGQDRDYLAEGEDEDVDWEDGAEADGRVAERDELEGSEEGKDPCGLVPHTGTGR